MKITFEHGTTRAVARAKIERAAEKAIEIAGGQVGNPRYEWTGDTLTFSFVAMGSSIHGSAEVTDTEVLIDVTLPLMFRSFERQAESRILGTLDEMFDDTRPTA